MRLSPGFLGSCGGCLALSIESTTASIALDIHLEDDGVVDQAIDGGDHHGMVRKDLVPVGKGLIGGDQHRAAFVACPDQLEQDGCLGMVLMDIGEIIEDQQVVSVEFGNRGLQLQSLSCSLQPLDEVSGSGEQHTVAVLDKSSTDC